MRSQSMCSSRPNPKRPADIMKALMRLLRTSFLLLLCGAVIGLGLAQQSAPRKKRILAIGQTMGWQHESVTRGMVMMWQLGRDTGLWDTDIKTDTQLVTKKKLPTNAKN